MIDLRKYSIIYIEVYNNIFVYSSLTYYSATDTSKLYSIQLVVDHPFFKPCL